MVHQGIRQARKNKEVEVCTVLVRKNEYSKYLTWSRKESIVSWTPGARSRFDT